MDHHQPCGHLAALEEILPFLTRDYELGRIARERLLVYGVWGLEDGSEVAFNRHFQPIWARDPGGPWRPTALGPDVEKESVATDYLYTNHDDKARIVLKSIAGMRRIGLLKPEA